jgi:hypothetical protein
MTYVVPSNSLVEATPSPEVAGEAPAAGRVRFVAAHAFVLHEADRRFPYGRLIRAGQVFEVDAANAPTVANMVRPLDDRGPAPIVTNVQLGPQ